MHNIFELTIPTVSNKDNEIDLACRTIYFNEVTYQTDEPTGMINVQVYGINEKNIPENEAEVAVITKIDLIQQLKELLSLLETSSK